MVNANGCILTRRSPMPRGIYSGFRNKEAREMSAQFSSTEEQLPILRHQGCLIEPKKKLELS